jgi:nicotinate-nucleotide adenylyltransferase
MVSDLPYAPPGQVVGLLGGSFDPAHAGHVHITQEALKRFGLDRVWWLVTPGNPLKARGPAPLPVRLAHARAIMRHPRVLVTDLEARLGTRYTAETIAALQHRYPGVRFVWLMGADNLAQFHKWERWREIVERVPLGVLARPGDRIPARTSKVAQLYSQYRVRKRDAFGLGHLQAPAWAFVNIPMQCISSSEIRESGQW